MLRYRVLGIDLDNTLHDYSSASANAMASVYGYVEEEFGIDPEILSDAYSRILASAQVNGFIYDIPSYAYRKERFKQLLTTFSVFALDWHFKQMLDRYQSTFLTNLKLNPGAVHLLQAAKGKGMKVAVITEGPHDAQERTLRQLKLDGYVDHLISSSRAGVTKTSGLFEQALTQLGVQPWEMIYVGDSIERDMRPAQQVGIRALHYRPRNAENGADLSPYIRVNSLKQVGLYY